MCGDGCAPISQQPRQGNNNEVRCIHLLIARYRDAGSARIVFELPSAGPEEVLPLLDECAELISKI
jgi:hypothetical protein